VAEPLEIVFDLETVFLSRELPDGWNDLHLMRVSCLGARIGPPYDEQGPFSDVKPHRPGGYFVFGPGDLQPTHEPTGAFCQMLHFESSQLPIRLIGWNIVDFDIPVYEGDFDGGPLRPAAPCFPFEVYDLMLACQRHLGHRVHLDEAARNILGEGKSGDGTIAPILYRTRRHQRLVDYCLKDVELTARIWDATKANGMAIPHYNAPAAPEVVAQHAPKQLP